MQRAKIGFAGEGWGAVSTLIGLQKYFDLECLTKDDSVKNKLLGNSNLIESFDDFISELIVCAGYRPIIPKKQLLKFEIINIHYSLLPAYRGLHSTAWAIMNGEKKLGLSIYKMNEFIDDGPIIFQKEFKNDALSSATFNMELMNQYVEDNIAKIIRRYLQDKLTPVSQEKSQASWVGQRSQTHNLIDFSKGFEYCQRLFRVLQSPYPKPQILYKTNLYTVGKVKFHNSNIIADISRILNIDDDGIWVKSADGYTILDELKDIDGNSINNHHFKLGNYLNV